MEVTLGQLAERWNNIVWGMDPYKGGDVPLLKMAEEDFEALEVTALRVALCQRHERRCGGCMMLCVVRVTNRSGRVA